jgi:peptidoglycan/xylan/chitin deacetylase (PgdA/CDA1 family)
MVVAGIAAGTAPAGAAGPPVRPDGPWPPRTVLAADPATVPPPRPGAAAAAAPCPPAASGVRTRAPGGGKTVALTFDDGPGASTEAIMGILEDAGVAATFFNIGVNMRARPATVQALETQGFLLANHTWAHPDLRTLTAAQQAAQMDRASDEQAQITGSAPCHFRPPYGAYNATTLSLAQARDLEVWNWSVDTEDWRATSGSADWVARIVRLGTAVGSQTHPVVLLHNQPRAMPATVAALPAIITFYRDNGFTFVDLDGRVAARHVTGDWDGNGTVTPGLVRGNTWYLRNTNSAGPANVVLNFGSVGDRVVTGDWDGNGTTTPGVVRGNTWYQRTTNAPADTAATSLVFGRSSDRVVTGDWNGDGTTTPGVVRGNTWYQRTTNAAANTAATQLAYARASDRLVTGDWNGDGTWTQGVLRGTTWFQRAANVADAPTRSFTYSP